MFIKNAIFCSFCLSLILLHCSCDTEDYCYTENCNNTQPKMRFLLYDVNPPEGFNLRRDVYMRFAVLAWKLKNSKSDFLRNFKLVLPPWSRLLHWRYSPTPERIPWSLFFDVPSLRLFAPVIEMHEFFHLNSNYSKSSKIVLDEVYILQHFEDMFETGNFKERMKIEKCVETPKLGYFHYDNITSKNVKCLSFHGSSTNLVDLLLNSSATTILINHAEVALHDKFGSTIYWQARRSMRFSHHLRRIAAEFRNKFLNSSDKVDGIDLPKNWMNEKPKRNAKGGPYLSVHLRRRDFLRRNNAAPTLYNISQQIIKLLEKLGLNAVFLATDATNSEYNEIDRILSSNFKLFRFLPTEDIIREFGDGGVAIVDQIICSHGRFFVGTYESTFSFRIQEEREILGFPSDSTFNCFCGSEGNCEKPSVWKIVY